MDEWRRLTEEEVKQLAEDPYLAIVVSGKLTDEDLKVLSKGFSPINVRKPKRNGYGS